MNKLALMVVLAGGLAACASNDPAAEGGGTKNAETVAGTSQSRDAVSDPAETPERRQVCKYKRTRGTGSVMERVCKWVDAE